MDGLICEYHNPTSTPLGGSSFHLYCCNEFEKSSPVLIHPPHCGTSRTFGGRPRDWSVAVDYSLFRLVTRLDESRLIGP